MIEQLRPGSSNICRVRRTHVPVDLEALQRAFDMLVHRHEMLRCGIRRSRVREVDWRKLYVDYKLVVAEDIEVLVSERATGDEIMIDDAPFDLRRPPLVRVRVAPEDGGSLVSISMPHGVGDMRSMRILWRDLDALYSHTAHGEPVELPRVSTFGAYAVDLYQSRSSGRLDRHIEFWRQQLAEAAAPPLPPRSSAASEGGVQTVDRVLEGDASDLVGQVARELGVTPFVVLTSAFATGLTCAFGWDEVFIHTPFENRRPTVRDVVGSFATLVVLRLRGVHGSPFAELARTVASTVLRATAHGWVPPVEAIGVQATQRIITPTFSIRVFDAGESNDARHFVASDRPPSRARTFGTDTDLMLDVTSYSDYVHARFTFNALTVEPAWANQVADATWSALTTAV